MKCIIIGINKYIEGNHLNYCVNDAYAVRDYLINQNFLGVDTKDIILITDKEDEAYKPLRSNILEHLDLISNVSNPEDSIIFYFAGHGDELDGEPVLLPSDYRMGRGIDSAIKIEDIKNTLMDSKAKFKLLVLDSCHSGAVPGREESGMMTQATYDVMSDVPEGFAILSSCSINQLSYDDDENSHGIFTYSFIKGVEGEADGNKDLKITIHELYDYISPIVQERAFYLFRKNQTPHMRENFNGIFLVSQLKKENGVVDTTFNKYSFRSINLFLDKFEKVDQSWDIYGFDNSERLEFIENKTLLALRDTYGFSNLSDDGKKITFPDGIFEKRYFKEAYDKYGELSLYLFTSYNIKNSISIDNVIRDMDNYYHLVRTISFITPYLINFESLESKCEKKSWKITKVSLKPKMLQFVVDVSTNGYRDYLISVSLYDEFTVIRVSSSSETYLSSGFYEHMNIEHITELLGDCFAS